MTPKMRRWSLSSKDLSMGSSQARSDGPRTGWKSCGSSSTDLLEKLEDLYWQGVERDIEDILKALREWSDGRFAEQIPLLNVKSQSQGFETFVKRATGGNVEREVRRTVSVIEASRHYTMEEQLAALLLQGAAFLDIDKLIEYRPPDEFDLWVTPRAPQLEVDHAYAEVEIPVFKPLLCGLCKSTIRGAYFDCVSGCYPRTPEGQEATQNGAPDIVNLPTLHVCEDCVRKDAHPVDHLRKSQKHCVVSSSITQEHAQLICPCDDWDLSNSDSPFPFTSRSKPQHVPSCPLLEATKQHNEARYNDLILHKNLQRTKEQAPDPPSRSLSRRHSSYSNPVLNGRPGGLIRRFSVLSASSSNSSKSSSSRGIMRTVAQPVAKKVAENIPFGNVHMALSIGPLVIENGVPDSNRGVLVTLRPPMQLLDEIVDGTIHELALSVGPSKFKKSGRTIYQADRPRVKRRVNAYMKQVVSGLFSGLSTGAEELQIIQCLAEESIKCRRERRRTQAYNKRKLERGVVRIVGLLRPLLLPRLQIYLQSIALKIFDSKVTLEWNIRTNHCQTFTEAILDHNLFGDLIATEGHCRVCAPQEPIYLLSFIHGAKYTKSDGPLSRNIRPNSKKSAPNGLTEEFLLRFRKYGHHNESDILDTLSEYWTDWGGFGSPIFPHQDLFPWDCTEAFGTGPENNAKCGQCDITQHVWAFPFDSWSLVHFHLFRERCFYPPSAEGSSQLPDIEWMQNRLRVLTAMQSLNTVAVAMAKTPEFRASCKWIPSAVRQQIIQSLKSRGTVQKPNMAMVLQAHSRARLGGIFRAQLESHLFEQSKYHDCELAPWADLIQPDQVEEYISLRDIRADVLTEIPPPKRQSERQRNRSPQLESNRNGPSDRGTQNGNGDQGFSTQQQNLSNLSVNSVGANDYHWDEPALDQYGNDVANDFDASYADNTFCTCDAPSQGDTYGQGNTYSQADNSNNSGYAFAAGAIVAGTVMGYEMNPTDFDMNDVYDAYASSSNYGNGADYGTGGSSYGGSYGNDGYSNVNSGGSFGASYGNDGYSNGDSGSSSGGFFSAFSNILGGDYGGGSFGGYSSSGGGYSSSGGDYGGGGSYSSGGDYGSGGDSGGGSY